MKYLLMLMMAGILSLGMVGCNNGPMEDAGESVDEAVTDTGNAIEDACEDASGEDC